MDWLPDEKWLQIERTETSEEPNGSVQVEEEEEEEDQAEDEMTPDAADQSRQSVASVLPGEETQDNLDEDEFEEDDDDLFYAPVPSQVIAHALDEYPKVTLVDLDQRMTSRKKHDMEPTPNPSLLNISNPSTTLTVSTGTEYVPVKVPKKAAWFNMEMIHSIEDAYFTSFTHSYDIEKSPDTYKSIRNTIVGIYRQKPHRYLSVAECMMLLDASLSDVSKIHCFLEHWGLINYQAFLRPEPTKYNTQPPEAVVRGYDAGTVAIDSSSDIYTPLTLKPDLSPARSNRCMSCQLPVSEYWFHTVQPYNFVICSECFSNGLFPEKLTGKDFVRISSVKCAEKASCEWTDEEVLRLLECIDMYGTDWPQISQYVGGKSAEDCIEKFLSLQYSDSVADEMDTQFWGLLGAEENPLVTFLNLIAASLNPGFASQGARAALRLLLDHNDVSDETVKKQKEAFDIAVLAVSQTAEEYREKERMNIERLTRKLIELRIKRCDAKMGLLQELSLKS